MPFIVFGDHTKSVKLIDFPCIIGADGTKLLRPTDPNSLDVFYLYFVLQASSYNMRDRGYARHFQLLKNNPLPIPPVEEQRRIVAKLVPLFAEIDKAEKAYNELTGSLAEQYKLLILDQAMRGQLVPQLDSEPEAEQLDATLENVPFNIPGKWRWTTICSIVEKLTDGTHHSPPNSYQGDFLYVTAKNIKNYGVETSTCTYVSADVHTDIYSRCNPELNDVLYIKDGATTGIVTVNNLAEPFSLLSSVALLKVNKSVINPWYLTYCMRSPKIKKLIKDQMKGTGIPRVTLKILKSVPIPVPPIEEQNRIIKKLRYLQNQMDNFS